MSNRINRLSQSVSYIIPAPTEGLNLRDSLDNMKQTEAIVLDNYIPKDTKLVLRKGYNTYYSSENPFLTLVAYKKYNKSRFIGISDGKAYNLTSSKNIRVYENVSFIENRCQTFQYKDYLYFMNGIEKPKVFYINDEGQDIFEDWSFSSEGLQDASIIAGAVSKQFLWFIEKGTMNVWHTSEAGNISGTLNKFDLSQISRFGGHILAVCCWTMDGGQGIDDLTVFLTSEGEAIVYSGFNPNSADNWELKGTYKISKPIGYQCTLAYQGDIVIITEDGYLPLSKVLPLSQAGISSLAFSDKIRGLVLDRVSNNYDKNGWQGIIYSRGGYAIFNVPVSRNFEQHVININNGAWCRFTNINSHCWCLFNDRLYFGSNYGVFKFDEGYSDCGNYIYGEIHQAYNNFGFDGLKKIQLLNPRTKSSTEYHLSLGLNMDYEDNKVTFVETIGQSGIHKWNEAKWASSKGEAGSVWQTLKGKIRSQWIACSATGYKASIVFKTQTKGNLLEWYDTGVRYETANGIM